MMVRAIQLWMHSDCVLEVLEILLGMVAGCALEGQVMGHGNHSHNR